LHWGLALIPRFSVTLTPFFCGRFLSATRIVWLRSHSTLPAPGQKNIQYSVPELEDLRNRAGIFSDVSVIWDVSVNLTGSKQPERLEFLAVSPNYFSMLALVRRKAEYSVHRMLPRALPKLS